MTTVKTNSHNKLVFSISIGHLTVKGVLMVSLQGFNGHNFNSFV